jgi:uncharacterized protein (DUF2147 family)
MGLWLTKSKTVHVRVAPCRDPANGPLCGTVESLLKPLDENGQPVAAEQVKDFRNADPKLKLRKVLGSLFLYNFKASAKSTEYENGTSYSAQDGKTYRSTVKLQPDGTLNVSGYVCLPLFGQTEVWSA